MKLLVKNGKPPKARENAADRATIGARFASDWLRGWRKVFLDESQGKMKQKTKVLSLDYDNIFFRTPTSICISVKHCGYVIIWLLFVY